MQPFGGNVSLPRVDKTKLELSVWSTTKNVQEQQQWQSVVFSGTGTPPTLRTHSTCTVCTCSI